MKSDRGKILAMARQNKQLSVDEIVDIARLGVMFDLSIGVLCWAESLQAAWVGLSKDIPSPDVLDIDRATLTEWQAYLSSCSYDILVLHGARAAQQTGQLSAKYAEALVTSVPKGLVVWV